MSDCSCVSNEKYIESAGKHATTLINQAIADVAITVAVALYNRKVTNDISEMQDDIAKGQMVLAEKVQAHAAQFYAVESALVSDAFGIQKSSPEYALNLQWKAVVTEAVESSRAEWLAVMRRSCLSPTACENVRFQREGELTEADIISFAARQAEGRSDALNDQRYEIQYKVLGIGRGILQNLTTAQKVAGNIATTATNMVAATGSSALEAYGYFKQGRHNPQWGHGNEVRASMNAAYLPPTFRQAASTTKTYALPEGNEVKIKVEALPPSTPKAKDDEPMNNDVFTDGGLVNGRRT